MSLVFMGINTRERRNQERHRDTETQRHRNTETQRHRDAETQRHRESNVGGIERRRGSCKKFIMLLLCPRMLVL